MQNGILSACGLCLRGSPSKSLCIELFSQVMSMKRFEYKHIRLDYKGRGITQEINLLDIDGQRIKGWGSSSNVPTLPEMFAALGHDGWELVSHVVNQDNTANGVTFHYYNFKREMS
jgi:hypothetical protein